MGESYRFPLAVVDGVRLEKAIRDTLLPGRIVYDASKETPSTSTK